MTRHIGSSDDDLRTAVDIIKRGELIAFPTETVYGLGARLDETALAKIFAAKRRPYSDPLICHFDTPQHARKYVRITGADERAFDQLAKAFWPGPLTIVAPAMPSVPPLVMAGTGHVGVRVPSHPIAHRFLALAEEPIAAPSANRFQHVSPTTARHVEEDLADAKVVIIDGGAATIGIESTVVSIEAGVVSILRPGFVTQADIERAGFCVRPAGGPAAASPGQQLKHYSPSIKTVLAELGAGGQAVPAHAVVIDFARALTPLASQALAYFDLSPTGSVLEALSRLYALLHEAECVPNAEICVLADIASQRLADRDAELATSLLDRMARAASQVKICVSPSQGKT